MEDINVAVPQYRRMQIEADCLIGVSRKIQQSKSRLNANWQGVEVTPINNRIDEVIYRLRRLNYDLTDFATDYLRICESKETK